MGIVFVGGIDFRIGRLKMAMDGLWRTNVFKEELIFHIIIIVHFGKECSGC